MTVDCLQEAVLDFLRGYGRSNTAALEGLAVLPNWRGIAQAELERRATSIVQALDDETLRAIAAGELDFNQLCREAARELVSKA
jgi:hypothetical protein